MGMRRPLPKAREETFSPGAACWRLYSLRYTIRATSSTVDRSKPRAAASSTLNCSSTMRCRIASSIS